MKIVIFGDFSSKLDEGMSKLSKTLFERLKENNEVVAIDTKDSLRPQTIRKVIGFKPDIVHYITGPTIRSFMILKFYSLLLKKAKVVSSAARPFFSGFGKKLISFLKPDMVLTQSSKWETFFRLYGIKTRQLFNGVDCGKYTPVKSLDEKESLRQKHGIPTDKFVVLHVGHLKENRNLEAFLKLQKTPRIQCMIVASTSTKANETIKQDLTSSGCLVVHEFVENIEELYRLADCYVFCVNDKPGEELPRHYNEIGVIDTPLSVMEAMACNLPIITTRFGALPLMFKEEGGFCFYDGSFEDLVLKLEVAKQTADVATRKMVLSHDWDNVIKKILEIYSEVSV